MIVQFKVIGPGNLRCLVPGLLDGCDWAVACATIKLWAWLRDMDINRIRGRSDHGIMFHAHFKPVRYVERFRVGCLCGWTSTAGSMESMVEIRHEHPHFHEWWCPHASLRTQPFGAVDCVECGEQIGWDAVACLEQVLAS